MEAVAFTASVSLACRERGWVFCDRSENRSGCGARTPLF
jgi:hypothetical protein